MHLEEMDVYWEKAKINLKIQNERNRKSVAANFWALNCNSDYKTSEPKIC